MAGFATRLRDGLVQVLLVVGRPARQRRDRALARAAGDRDAVAAARLLRRASLDVAARAGRLRGRPAGATLPSIAVLARSRFTDDARLLARDLGADRVLLIPRAALKTLAGASLPPGIGDLNYRSSVEHDAAPMLRHRAFLAEVWAALDPGRQVRLVLTGNAGYWAEVEFGGALEASGVAFVALHKENLKSAGHAARWEPVYRTERAVFAGRAVLVQNTSEAGLQQRGGIVTPDRLAVVGMARLDTFHAHRRRTAGTPCEGDVVVASFLPGANLPTPPEPPGREPTLGMPLPDAEPRPEHLVDACLALHRVAVDLARSLPERRVVVKTKGRDQDRTWVPRILDHVAGAEELPPNLAVLHGGDAVAVTRGAAVVVGLNSTMLLEALAAGRPAVVLELGEMAGPARGFLVDLAGATTVVREESEAVATIRRVIEARPPVPEELIPEVAATLERWTGNADGRATQRTVARLRALMDATP